MDIPHLLPQKLPVVFKFQQSQCGILSDQFDYFSTKGGVNFNSELWFSYLYHVRNGKDLTEAEDIKKRWQEYTELCKKRSS